MKHGVFTQLNAKVLSGSHHYQQKAKNVSSKVKTMLNCFYGSKGIINKEFVSEGQASFKYCFKYFETHIKVDFTHNVF